MSRFTESKKGSNKTTNFEGETAYKLSPKMELYTMTCCSVMHNQFYRDNDEWLDRLRVLIWEVEPQFIANLAAYAREKMYLRTVPMVLMVELAKIGKAYFEEVARVIKRADELYEILGYYQQANNRDNLKKLSHAIKKGVGLAFNKFDEYQFAKYSRDVTPSLRDALFVSHPKPETPLAQKLFDKIATDSLSTPYTWEVELSEKGNTAPVWQELIESGRLPYMAMLRNLRNIIQAGVADVYIKKVCDTLSYAPLVEKSKQLPFRFYSAYREVKVAQGFGVKQVLEAIEKAALIATKNIKIDMSNALIASDTSGSMTMRNISPRSTISLYDIGLVLGAFANQAYPNAICGCFSEQWGTWSAPSGHIMESIITSHAMANQMGYSSTNGHKPIEWLIQKGLKADKLLFFSDMQMWNSGDENYWGQCNIPKFKAAWDYYKEIVPNAELYLFDLAGYGTTMMYDKDVYTIAGWSDKVFDMLGQIKEGSKAIEVIENYK